MPCEGSLSQREPGWLVMEEGVGGGAIEEEDSHKGSEG